MGFFIVKDLVYDIKDRKRNRTIKNIGTVEEGVFFHLARVTISNWVEVIFLLPLVGLAIFGEMILKHVLIGLLALFILREILQIFVSMKRYLTSLENWMEMGIIILTTVLLVTEGSNFHLN